MPALSAAQVRDASVGLSADDIEAIIDRKIAKAIQTGLPETIVVTDRDLGRGKAIWSYVVADGAGSALLDDVCTRYRDAGYIVAITKAPPFKRDCLDDREHCLLISWASERTGLSRAAVQAIAA